MSDEEVTYYCADCGIKMVPDLVNGGHLCPKCEPLSIKRMARRLRDGSND